MSLEAIGQLAIDLRAAGIARKHAKNDLRERYREFSVSEGIYHGVDIAIVTNSHPRYEEMQEYAADAVAAYKRAKLTEYNIKRKLERAIKAFHGR